MRNSIQLHEVDQYIHNVDVIDGGAPDHTVQVQ
jgi:hypothetical protein